MASRPEAELALQIRALGLPPPVAEYRFAAVAVGLGPGVRDRLIAARLQDWRYDLAWPRQCPVPGLGGGLAVEIQGGLWTGGRHTRGSGYEQDLLKGEAGLLLGWTIYYCSPRRIKSGDAVQAIEKLLCLIQPSGGWT